MLSKHSSNPFQASSDDPINAKFLNQIQPVLQREKNRGDQDPSSVHRQHDDNGSINPQFEGEEDELMLGNGSEHDMSEEKQPEETGILSDEDEEFDPNDEAFSLYLKEPQEQAQIMAEIKDLEASVEGLAGEYKLVDRLGEGTFSSVYKAIDLNYDETYNAPWQGHHPSSSSAHFQSVPYPKTSKVFVAIKRIYVTSSPLRIQNEIELMEICRGCRHVAQLITAFRNRDQVVVVMPYHACADFRHYYSSMPLSSVQSYLRCLLRALRDIHAREIVHRDVKPANFLFHPETGEGVLVDFGLAQKIDYDVETTCNHTSATKSIPHGTLKTFSHDQVKRFKNILNEQRKKSAGPSDRVGWLAEDTRPGIKANRAGTRGFRAPEVLFKCEDQTVALDMWSVGTILLSILSCRFPIFNANDDIEALMEIAAILGKRRMEKCAQLHNRTFCTNVPTIDYPGVTWEEMCTRLNPSLTNPAEPLPQRARSSSSPALDKPSKSKMFTSPDPDYSRATDPLLPYAFELLEKMLQPDHTKRITARDALAHPFLEEKVRLCEDDEDEGDDIYSSAGGDGIGNLGGKEPAVESREYRDPITGKIKIARGDDLYFPNPFGEGICAHGHWKDDDTQTHCIYVTLPPEGPPRDAKQARKRQKRDEILQIVTVPATVFEPWDATARGTVEGDEAKSIRIQVKQMAAGEGIAIGVDPCEFHREGVIDARSLELLVRLNQRPIYEDEDDEMPDNNGVQEEEEW